MKYRSLSLLLLALLPTATLLGGEPDAAGFVVVKPDEVQYEGGSNLGPAQDVLIGDPTKEGFYLLRARFAPGVMTYPHYHSQDRYVTVISGTWYSGTGLEFDKEAAIPLGPGSFMFHPANAPHYDGSNNNEEVVVEIKGMGPVETVRFEPEGAQP